MKKNFLILLCIFTFSTAYSQNKVKETNHFQDSVFQSQLNDFKDSLTTFSENQYQLKEEVNTLNIKEESEGQLGWLEIITLFIAMIGGITGVISIFNDYSKKAKFFANIQSTVVSGGDIDKKEYQSILFFLYLTNKGEEPIVPVLYNLKVKTKTRSKWINFEPAIIPPELNSFVVNETQYNDVKKQDLSFFLGSIKKGDVYPGALMFISYDASKEDIAEGNILEYELICTDVTKKKFKHKMKYESNGSLPKNIVLINHNITR